jgi:hypothetical protein
MILSRRRHRRGLNFTVGGNQLQHRSKGLAPELSGDSIGSVHVRVNDSYEPDRLSLLFEFFVDAGMVSPKNAYTDDGDRNRILGWQVTFSAAGCRKEIVNPIRGKITKRRFPRN